MMVGGAFDERILIIRGGLGHAKVLLKRRPRLVHGGRANQVQLERSPDQ
jgi:hypothetical protein